jgi:ribose transport system permease protein
MRKSVIWMLLAGTIVLSTILSKGVFFSPENVLQLLRQLSFVAILATGQTIVMLTGGIDLSVGSVVALSSCISVMAVNAGYSNLVTFLIPVLLGTLIGSLNGFLVTLVEIIPFASTLATLIVARGFAYVITRGSPQYMLPAAIERFGIYGNQSVGIVPVPVLIMGFVVLVGYFLLYRTRFGQHIYAVGNNEETSRLAGIHINRTKFLAYCICGMFAGLAGLMYASRLSLGNPAEAGNMNFDSIIPVVMGGAALSGGKGSLTNSIICVIILGTITTIMNMLNVSPFIQDGAKGVILLIAVYFLAEKKS